MSAPRTEREWFAVAVNEFVDLLTECADILDAHIEQMGDES